MFKGLNYQYTTGVSFISDTNYGGGATAAAPYSRWYINGTLLIPTTNYDVGYSQYNVNVINNFPTVITGDVIRLELYSTLQDYLTSGINNGNGTLLEFDEDTIRPKFTYLETYAPFPNGVLSTDITDKSALMNSTLSIDKCSTTPVNSHALSSLKIINNRVSGDDAEYEYGRFSINGVDFTNADVDEQVLQTGGFNFALGVFTHDAENIVLNSFSSSTSIVFNYEHNGINTADDFSFNINEVGFVKIGADGVLDGYKIANGSILSALQTAPTTTSTFSVELTPTQYILRVDGSTVFTKTRTVQYSTTVGSLSITTPLPINTPVNYLATSVGPGYIQALFDGTVIARQSINVVAALAPVFTGGYTHVTDCPATFFDLEDLIPTNSAVDSQLEWHTSSSPTGGTLITDLTIEASGVYYAVFHNTILNCYNNIRAVSITIFNCSAVDDSFILNMNQTLMGDVSLNDDPCV